MFQSVLSVIRRKKPRELVQSELRFYHDLRRNILGFFQYTILIAHEFQILESGLADKINKWNNSCSQTSTKTPVTVVPTTVATTSRTSGEQHGRIYPFFFGPHMQKGTSVITWRIAAGVRRRRTLFFRCILQRKTKMDHPNQINKKQNHKLGLGRMLQLYQNKM